MVGKAKNWSLPEGWDESDLVQDWLSRIKRKKIYRRELGNFLEWIQLTPEELIGKREETLENEETERWLENEVIKYVDYCYTEKKLKESSVRSYLRTVQSFLRHHFRRRPLRFLRNEIKHEEVQEVKKSHRPKWVLDNTELRTLFQITRNNFDKAVLLGLAHSGMSPADISQITITEQLLDDIEKERHYYMEKPREKSSVLQQTFLSEECLHYTALYLKERGEYSIGDPLFVTQKGTVIDDRYLRERFNGLAETAFGKDRVRDFKVKNFRDILYNASKLANHSAEITESLLGWGKSGAKDSYKLNEIVIRTAYDQCFKYLSINGTQKTREKLDEIIEKVQEIDELKRLNKQLILALDLAYKELANFREDVQYKRTGPLTGEFVKADDDFNRMKAEIEKMKRNLD